MCRESKMRNNWEFLFVLSAIGSVAGKVKLSADNWGQTNIKTTRSSFVWTISNYSLHNKDVGECFESPIIKSSTPDDYRWSLELYPKGHNQDHEGYVSVYLIYKLGPLAEVKVDYNISIFTGSLVEIHRESAKSDVIVRGLGRGWHEFYNAADLYDQSGGKIVVYVEYFAYIGESKITGNCSENELSEPLEHLAVFEQLIDSERFSDVELVVQERTIRAHRNILAVQSPGFDALFDSEERLSTIEITEHEEEVVMEALRFMYTGRVNKLDSLVEKLFAFAVTYDIEGLRELCETKLCQIMDFDNAIEILKLADRHGAQKLKNRAINFIAANVNEFLQILEFKELESANPRMMLEIFNEMASSTCQ